MAQILVAFLLGTIVGSFLNVCIYRIPRGISLLRPRSFCPACKAPIAPWENVPVLAYLYLRGRCRHCGHAIPVRYPLVEVATGLLFVAVLVRFGLTLDAFRYALLGCVLLVLAFVDLEHQVLPDVLTLPALAAGVGTAFLLGWGQGLRALLGAGSGVLVAVAIAALGRVLFRQESFGGGDLKLMACIGAYTGWAALLGIVFLAFVLALPIILVGLAANRLNLGSRIPFGPFLATATMVVLFAGHRLWEWYRGCL
ncbi:MAG: prepilin peptidase [candidate division KSB1 bacterium]|nr:prepilin peptidase [candidate division KSB1 bacterium]